MVMSSAGLGPESDSELYKEITDPSFRQGGHRTTGRAQMSGSNKNLVIGFRWERHQDTLADRPSDAK
jgi:hypothetical protein